MLTAFATLCHAPADAPFAHELGAWLDRNTPCRIRYTECGDGAQFDLVEAAEQSMAGVAVILLLSPAAAPRQWIRSRWEPVLLEQPVVDNVGVATLLVKDCRFPDLLRRRDHFDSGLAGRRALKRWLLARFPAVVDLPTHAADPADPGALEKLRVRLADEPGMVTDVPAATGLAFARDAERDFEGVIWLDCTRRSRSGVIGDLCYALGLKVSGVIEENEEALCDMCAARRLLLIFHNLAAAPFPRAGKSSFLLTAVAPAPRLSFAELARSFSAWSANPAAALAALRDLDHAVDTHPEWPAARSLAFDAVALLSRRHERAAELRELLDRFIDRAWREGDEDAMRRFEWERGWIASRTNLARPATSPTDPGQQMELF